MSTNVPYRELKRLEPLVGMLNRFARVEA